MDGPAYLIRAMGCLPYAIIAFLFLPIITFIIHMVDEPPPGPWWLGIWPILVGIGVTYWLFRGLALAEGEREPELYTLWFLLFPFLAYAVGFWFLFGG